MRAVLAAPSTGAAASFTCRTPSRMPTMAVRPARGVTRTERSTPLGFGDLQLVDDAQRGSSRSLDRPRPVEQHLVLALLDVLLADELQRVAEGRDGALERALHVAPLQPEAVDLALHFLDARLRFLQQQVGAALGLAHQALALGLGVQPDLVGQFLRGQQRVAEVALAFAMLLEAGLRPSQVVAEAVRLAQRRLVVVGRFGQDRLHFSTVETAHYRLELLLPQVERGHLH